MRGKHVAVLREEGAGESLGSIRYVNHQTYPLSRSVRDQICVHHLNQKRCFFTNLEPLDVGEPSPGVVAPWRIVDKITHSRQPAVSQPPDRSFADAERQRCLKTYRVHFPTS